MANGVALRAEACFVLCMSCVWPSRRPTPGRLGTPIATARGTAPTERTVMSDQTASSHGDEDKQHESDAIRPQRRRQIRPFAATRRLRQERLRKAQGPRQKAADHPRRGGRDTADRRVYLVVRDPQPGDHRRRLHRRQRHHHRAAGLRLRGGSGDQRQRLRAQGRPAPRDRQARLPGPGGCRRRRNWASHRRS